MAMLLHPASTPSQRAMNSRGSTIGASPATTKAATRRGRIWRKRLPPFLRPLQARAGFWWKAKRDITKAIAPIAAVVAIGICIFTPI